MRWILVILGIVFSGCATQSTQTKIVQAEAGINCEVPENAAACREAAMALMAEEYTPAAGNRAWELLEAACRHQDQEACHGLAELYEKGIGTPQNLPEATRLYRANCDAGYTPSCNNLALILAREDRDPSQAQEVLELACKGGEAIACFNLGFRAESGTLASNKEIAASYYRRSCELGYAEGCYYIGVMLRYGDGVEKDEAGGLRLYEKSCQAGYSRACSAIGSLFETGTGAEKSNEKATKYYRQACDSGFARGCTNLGIQAEKAGGGAALFELGCRKGDGQGCSRLGVLQLNGTGGAEKSAKKALLSFLRACELGWAAGCSNLGVLHEEGLGTEVDFETAEKLYERACDLEETQACLNLAEMMADGRGVEKNMDRATDLYMKACEGGLAKACTALGRRWLDDPKHQEFGKQLIERGCAEGDQEACE